MARSFHANRTVVTDEETYFLVCFADEEFDTCHYLMLQRAKEFDEQDVRFGMNDVYIEFDDQGWSDYGVIRRFELHRDRVFVVVDEELARKMDGESETEVQFSLDAEKFAELKAGLHQVFEGFSYFVDKTALWG
jgi:hypothetical protein